jgi:hypothetical protein
MSFARPFLVKELSPSSWTMKENPDLPPAAEALVIVRCNKCDCWCGWFLSMLRRTIILHCNIEHIRYVMHGKAHTPSARRMVQAQENIDQGDSR